MTTAHDRASAPADTKPNRPELGMLTVVTPAYNEQDNLATLHDRLCAALEGVSGTWEWVIVDDHSSDRTPEVIAGLHERDPRVRGVRLAHNHGSHAALRCALSLARGNAAVIIAADHQDPPETILALVREWQQGAQVVWAVRTRREGETARVVGLSRLYFWIMRRYVGLDSMPADGADFVLLDRLVIDALGRFPETNVSLFALLSWMGFRQKQIGYVKKARLGGESGWSLEKRLKLAVDSVTSFSYRPIRMVTYTGFIVAGLGFLYSLVVIVNGVRGLPVQGWASLMVVVLSLGGLQLITLGVLGEYLWRTLDAARQRPIFLVERQLGVAKSDAEPSSEDV